MPHQLSLPDHKGGFIDGNGRLVKAGDKVLYKFGHRVGTLDEALLGGEASVTWADGTFGTVKWRHLCKILL